MKEKTTPKNNLAFTTTKTILMVVESAVMIALATVLSLIKITELPLGGSITAFSMLPIIIIAYRYRTKWGLLSAFAYGLIQLMFGLNNLKYGTSAIAVISIILFDYLIAFGVVGFGGIFRDKFKKIQPLEIALGAIVALMLRYICHVVVGYYVWDIWAPEGTSVLWHSITYNASYMFPEILITVIGALILCSMLDFRSEFIGRISKKSIANLQSIACFLVGVSGILCSILFYLFNLINHLIEENPIVFSATHMIFLIPLAVGIFLLVYGYILIIKDLKNK